MNFVFDILLLALFVLFIILGYKRGFIKTVSGLVALVVAVLLASSLSGPIANAVYTDTVHPAVLTALEEEISTEVLPSEEKLDAAIENLPGWVSALMAVGDVDDGAAILDKVNTEEMGATAAATITDVVITPIVLPLMQMLCSVLLFLVAYIVVSLLLGLLDLVAKLPILKQLNKILGLIAGVATGALWVIFAARILYLLAWMGIGEWLTPAILDDTWLVSFANSVMPTFEL